MRILVCVKQSLETGEMSRLDEFALEAALVLKEAGQSATGAEVSIHVITLGSADAAKIIRRAYGLGADHGIHIVWEKGESALLAPFVTASYLAKVAGGGGYDLILTGIMSEETLAGQIGPMLAELVGFPSAVGVVRIEPPENGKFVIIECELENGRAQRLKLQLPCVLSLQAGINTLRYPSLSKMLAADKKTILTLPAGDLFPHAVQPKETVVALEEPEKTRHAMVLRGSLEDQADALVAIFRERDFVYEKHPSNRRDR